MSEQIHYDADILSGGDHRCHTVIVRPPLDHSVAVTLRDELNSCGSSRGLAVSSNRESIITSSLPNVVSASCVVVTVLDRREMDYTLTINGVVALQNATDTFL
jgi:hypothetical protein